MDSKAILGLINAIPTLKKAYLEPETEDISAWSLFFSGNILNLWALEDYNFYAILYPAYLFAVSGIILSFLLRGKLLPPQQKV